MSLILNNQYPYCEVHRLFPVPLWADEKAAQKTEYSHTQKMVYPAGFLFFQVSLIQHSPLGPV